MKAAVLKGIGRIEIQDVADPVIQRDNDVLIRMGRAGLCGSDLHYYTTGRIGAQIVEYPFIIGHEGAGVVEGVGAAVNDLKPGDRIAIEPAMPCWECDQCRAGRHHTCRKLRFLGCPGQSPGCLSEYIVMPSECCFKIQDKMTLEQAMLSEPLAIGVYAAKLAGRVKGARIGILGAGPIGLCVMAAARAEGAEKIYVTEKIPERMQIARNHGADWAGDARDGDIADQINGLEPEQLDIVFECCGQQEALDVALEILKPGGKLMIAGIPETDRVSFSIDHLRRKEICVQNVRRQVDCVQAALDMIDNGVTDVDFMATHHFHFDQIAQAFELVVGYRDGVVKAIIDMA
ncbi:alcohol dehydrogenase catalytic domain-containing protein [Candidatus Sumerlaeota bacterium]|nr:alcohol dehydrogenase catalytic domain-containing protein [Candidatus Sumerlaeota bacterium]